jgi:hypothetical protein
MLAPWIEVFKTKVDVHSLCKPVILRIALRITKNSLPVISALRLGVFVPEI